MSSRLVQFPIVCVVVSTLSLAAFAQSGCRPSGPILEGYAATLRALGSKDQADRLIARANSIREGAAATNRGASANH
jgi:hypothetical protein